MDRVLHDGDAVKLGGVVLVAHKTPGHTKGCTTWTFKTHTADGQNYNVVIIGSMNVNAGFKLVNNAKYPQIAQRLPETFRVMKSLHPAMCFLGAHGNYLRHGGEVRAVEGWRRRIRLSIRKDIRVISPNGSRRSGLSGRSSRKNSSPRVGRCRAERARSPR